MPRILRPLGTALMLLALRASVQAQEGPLLERTPHVVSDRAIAQVRAFMPDIDSLLAQVRLYRITYLSDGLRVKGYLAEPAAPGRYPGLIFNRGGNREFGKLNDGQLLRHLVPMARWGYVVVAGQYRGNDGGEGREEFGGADVNDVLALMPVLAQLPAADTARIGMVGMSRGGLMTYLALTRTTRLKAAVVRAGMADAFRLVAERPEMAAEVFVELMPGYAAHPDSVLLTRSPARWADRLCATTPILLLHGTGDRRVPPQDALDMAGALQACRHPFRLLMFEDADHGLSEFRHEADEATRVFLDAYVRDGRSWPSLEPHGP